jgi:hypothetical protein
MTDEVVLALVKDIGEAAGPHVSGLPGPQAMGLLLTAWAELAAKCICDLNPFEKWTELEGTVGKVFSDTLKSRVNSRRSSFN